jgi:Sulfotransferase domain/Protein of unknown function (DUF1232)
MKVSGGFGRRDGGDGDPRDEARAPRSAQSLPRLSWLGQSVGRPTAHILIACMPKSGSSLLSGVIARLPGYRRVQLIPDYDRREQELDEFCLRQVDRFSYVAQHHVRYSHWTAEMCRDYQLAPVVLVRNLLDVAVSLRDALRKDGPVWPFFFAEPRHAALSDADLEEMIVRLALPWYVNFYMGWRQAPDALLVHYEDLIADPVGTVGRVLAHSGATASTADIEAAVREIAADDETRFNVGVAGRGAGLRPDLVPDVLQMVEFYPEAASDPYIESLRMQGQTAQSGRMLPAHPVSSPPERTALTPARRWWRRNAPRIGVRILAPLALVACALAYWLWPNDLVPDTGFYGRLDDLSFLALACVLAGRLTLYRPGLHRLRRD